MTLLTRLSLNVEKRHLFRNEFLNRSLATDSLGDIWKIIYLGFEKSQRSVTHDSLRYINILTYLLTYLNKIQFVLSVWDIWSRAVCWLHVAQNPMTLRTLKFVARDPFISREQQAAASAFSVGQEGYTIQ